MWKKMFMSLFQATLPKRAEKQQHHVNAGPINIQSEASSPSSLSLQTSDRTSMSTPRRSFCAFLPIFLCLWDLPTATN
jgi:hypothetical protein